MKHEMTIKYLKCRANLNFEVDFRVNSAISMIATKWIFSDSKNGLFLSIMSIFLSSPTNIPLMKRKNKLFSNITIYKYK